MNQFSNHSIDLSETILINTQNSQGFDDKRKKDLEYLLQKAALKALHEAKLEKEERLIKILDYIPNVISNFRDCNSEEEYRMLAKKEDGTLATIQVLDPKSGYNLYKPIGLNLRNYKEFYFETLGYALAYYLLFYRNFECKITDYNDNERSGMFEITDKSLPHILGLESKFVSSKPCPILNKIIPGYNNLSILEKIHSLVTHYHEIIKYEEENGIDIFNYYKYMQKNKDFLLMGRFVRKEDPRGNDAYQVCVIKHRDNQLILYKKSNMNSIMNRGICKMLLQQLKDGTYFPKSMQSVSEEMLSAEVAKEILSKGVNVSSPDGRDFIIEAGSNFVKFEPISNEEYEIQFFEEKVLAAPEENEIKRIGLSIFNK